MSRFNRKNIDNKHDSFVTKPHCSNKSNGCKSCCKVKRIKHTAVHDYDPRNLCGWIYDPCDKPKDNYCCDKKICNDHKKDDKCKNCDPNCCDSPCIDVQKKLVTLAKCTNQIKIDGIIFEVDIINVVYELIITNKTCEHLGYLQIQDSLAGLDTIMSGISNINISLDVQSCDDNIKILCPVDIVESCGNLLDPCESGLGACKSVRILLNFTFKIDDFVTPLIESSCTLSKLQNSITVTGCIEPKCKDKCSYHLKTYKYGCEPNKHDNPCHQPKIAYTCLPCGMECCKKSKAKEICPIVVHSDPIFKDGMTLSKKRIA